MSTAARRRVRSSLEFSRLENSDRLQGRETPLRRERMTESGRLEVLDRMNSQDWTGGMQISPSGRFRVVESPRERQRVISRQGIRKDAARLFLCLLAAAMILTLICQMASIGISASRQQKLSSRIEIAQGKNWELRDNLAQMSGDISVCTKAVELNLISSNGAATIPLTAPESATLVLAEPRETGSAESAELRTNAAGL